MPDHTFSSCVRHWRPYPLFTSHRKASLIHLNGAPRPWTKAVALKAKAGTQRLVYAKMLPCPAGWGTERLRHKLERWHLPGLPGPVAEKVLRLVPPRVHTAVFSTLWNRWCTGRRFQLRGSCSCLLGCRSQAEDSIEHYLRCPIVLDVARARLGLHMTSTDSWAKLLLATPAGAGTSDVTWLTRCALLLYTVYRATNAARHSNTFAPEEARRALIQAIYEGARGHRNASVCADTWALDLRHQ